MLRTTQLTNTNRPKSGVVTDGARLYFIENQSILSQTSVAGGETFPIPHRWKTLVLQMCLISLPTIRAVDEYRAWHGA